MTTHTTELDRSASDVVIDLRDPRPEQKPPGGSDAGRVGLILLLVLNGLNLLDAGLTLAVTETGIAREGNPVVEWLTLPGKVALVTVLSLVLWRLKPRALIVPVVGYALVVCYTLAGTLFLT
ncbi:MAG TPA: DUF5658 family protein [Actinomycetota bacterium]|nr:DUF5658 family protein [Actinomycetota bacterium]